MIKAVIKMLFNRQRFKAFRRISLLAAFYNSTIGKGSRIFSFSKVSNATIGTYCYISYDCVLNNCSIGNYCSFARSVKIGLGIHPSNYISTSPVFYSKNNPLKVSLIKEQVFEEFKKTTIGNDVWIGVNAVILDGISIGDGAIIGANAVVTKDIPAYAIVGGVPAKIIKYRFNEDEIQELLKLQWWDKDVNELAKFSDIFQTRNVTALKELFKNNA